MKVQISLPVKTSHNLIVLSSLALARILPLGLKATEFTPPDQEDSPCPLRVRGSLLAKCQIFIVLSSLPLANVCPSGLKTTDITLFECPLRVRTDIKSCIFRNTSQQQI